MAAGELLGSFEQIVLLALVQLGPNAYGMSVRHEIHSRTRRNVSIGAVYTTLERLQAKGHVRSSRGEATVERGGRVKRFFEVTPQGERALQASQEAVRQMTMGLGRRWKTI